MNRHGSESVFVWGGAVDLLRSYVDAQGLRAVEARASLTALGTPQRLPISTWWTLLDQIDRAQPGGAVGLRIGQHFQLHHFGIVGYLAASCETLEQAVMRFQRFQPLLHNLTPTLISPRGSDLQISWDARYGPSTSLSNEVVVSSLLRLCRILTGNDALAFSAVLLPGAAPRHLGPYRRILGCLPRYGAKTVAVHLPLSTLAQPINSRDPHLRNVLDQQAEALLQALPQPDALMAQLQQEILVALQDGAPSLQRVAQRMGMAERSLYRRLQARRLQYQEVLSRTRYRLAQRYLADPQLSLTEVASLLGYSEQSAFTRAFKSWCGQTPLRYRKAMPKASTDNAAIKPAPHPPPATGTSSPLTATAPRYR